MTTEPFLRTLSLDEPWATLLLLANTAGAQVKAWETRDNPPAGRLRPTGVKGIPGFAVAPGTRLAVHATDRAPALQGMVGGYRVAGDLLYDLDDRPAARLLRRRILGTVRVTHAAKVITPDMAMRLADFHYPGATFVVRDGDRLTWVVFGDGMEVIADISDQLPYGDWTLGRWGIRTNHPRRASRECPWCAGTGHDPGTLITPGLPAADLPECPVCLGAGGSAAIVTPGGQGVWRWPRKGEQPARSTRVRARVSLTSRAADEATLDTTDHEWDDRTDYPTETVTHH